MRPRIYANFVERLIGIARGLCAEEPFGVDLTDAIMPMPYTIAHSAQPADAK